VDNSGASIATARQRASELGLSNVSFAALDLDSDFDIDGPFNAIADTQTITYLDDPLSVLGRTRELLEPDGILLSVPPIGSPDRAKWYCDLLANAGYVVSHFSFTVFQEQDQFRAYPIFVAAPTGHPLRIDLDSAYREIAEYLESRQIEAWQLDQDG
jgi:hypothetical protein